MRWTYDNFPELKSPLSAGSIASSAADSNMMADFLIPLCSGPGKEKERLETIQKVLTEGTNHDVNSCALQQDQQHHTAAFYAASNGRTEMLKSILIHEKDW